jgi:hypothetical protein
MCVTGRAVHRHSVDMFFEARRQMAARFALFKVRPADTWEFA